jgi:hypothetical protein
LRRKGILPRFIEVPVKGTKPVLVHHEDDVRPLLDVGAAAKTKQNPPPSESREAGDKDDAQRPPKRLPALMSASDLASHFNLPRGAVDIFLRRYKTSNKDCFQETDSPRRNEPQIMYWTRLVVPALREHFNVKERSPGV